MSSITTNFSRGEALSKMLDRITIRLDELRDTVCERLANVGRDTANEILEDHVWSGETIGSLTAESAGTKQNTKSTSSSSVVYMESPAALFVEFGAGVTYGAGHPFAAELGMGPGTFPGQTHAFNQNGWWFKTDDPKLATKTDRYGYYWHHSYGNPPHMPMYHAAKAVLREAKKVTQEAVKEIVE